MQLCSLSVQCQCCCANAVVVTLLQEQKWSFVCIYNQLSGKFGTSYLLKEFNSCFCLCIVLFVSCQNKNQFVIWETRKCCSTNLSEKLSICLEYNIFSITLEGLFYSYNSFNVNVNSKGGDNFYIILQLYKAFRFSIDF